MFIIFKFRNDLYFSDVNISIPVGLNKLQYLLVTSISFLLFVGSIFQSSIVCDIADCKSKDIFHNNTYFDSLCMYTRFS